tara:strand:- start:102 stop:275 length:174 start_codon:yes stop_codon:yes gene_type:complete
MIKLTVKASVNRQMETIMMVSGKTIIEKEGENIFGMIKMNILVIGNKIKEMAMVNLL